MTEGMPDELIPLLKTMDNKQRQITGNGYDKLDEMILEAARKSDVKELKRLIAKDPESTWKIYLPSKDTLLHRIAYGAYSNCVEAAEFILDKWKDFDINLQNKKLWTALHYACENQQPQLVDLLINRGANATITNDNGENSFQLVVKCYTPKAIQIADILLKSNSQLIDTSKSGNNTVEIVLKHSAVEMLAFLWDNFNGVIKPSLEDGPSLALAVQKGDGLDTVKCVNFLLDILPASTVNEKDENGNTALHVAAMRCYVDIFEALVSSTKTKVSLQNKKGETCLHLLAQAGKYSNPLPCVKILFMKSHELRNNELQRRRIILFENPKFEVESPLWVAVKNRTTRVAQLLIKVHGEIRAIAKETELLAEIYEKTPEAIKPLLDKCITYNSSSSDDEMETITIDFGPITGFDFQDIRNESNLIHRILKAPVKQQAVILSHPVVNIFLIEKWKKLQPLTYLYIGLYAFWLLTYSFLCYELYPPNCPFNSTEDAVHPGWTEFRIFRSLGFQQRLETESCNFNAVMARLFALILLVYTPLFVLQEAIKFHVTDCSFKTYIFNFVTLLQWIRHLVVVVNIIPAFMEPTNIPVWEYHVGVFMFILAWGMLLNDLANIPAFNLNLSILKVTVINYAKFLLSIGFPILVAFVPALCRYVAKGNQFLYLPFGIIKNFILMTGEVDYKETFYGDEGPDLQPTAIVGQFILVIVVFGFGLVLANVLTSVAVKNFQDLFKDAEYNVAVMQLKSIHVFDSLVVWLSGFSKTVMLSQLLTKWNHLEFDGETRIVKNMKIGGLPDDLKLSIKEIVTQDAKGKTCVCGRKYEIVFE